MHSLTCDVSFDFSERQVTQYNPLNESRPFRSSNSGPESRIPNRRDAFEGLSKDLRNIRLKRAIAAVELLNFLERLGLVERALAEHAKFLSAQFVGDEFEQARKGLEIAGLPV